MKKYKHLFFDLDNTILDFDYASHHAFSAILESKNLPIGDSYLKYKKVNAMVWGEFERGEITAVELRAKRFDLFLEEMGWSGDGMHWNKMYLDNVIGYTKFIPGAKSMINKLSANYSIHIVTNGLKEVQRPRLKRAQLDNILSSITVSDEIGSAKPQGEFFKVAKENAKVESNKSILMIGDSYNSDIKGAYDFGIDCCWLNRKSESNPQRMHNYEIRQISELKASVKL